MTSTKKKKSLKLPPLNIQMYKNNNSGEIIGLNLVDYKNDPSNNSKEIILIDIIKYMIINKVQSTNFIPENYYAKCKLCGNLIDTKTKIIDDGQSICNHFNIESIKNTQKKYGQLIWIWDSSIQDTKLPHYYIVGPEGIKFTDKYFKKYLLLGGIEYSQFNYSENDLSNIKKFNQVPNKTNKGAFGIVHHCKSKDGKVNIAIKKINRPNVTVEVDDEDEENNVPELPFKLKKKKTKLMREIEKEISILYESNKYGAENIVKFYLAYQNESKDEMKRDFYLVMEDMNGGNLLQLLEQFPNFFKKIPDIKIAEEIIYCILSQVIDGIMFLNFKLFAYHYDIKAENVLFNSEGEVKLCDFGSAKFLKDPHIDREDEHYSTNEYQKKDIFKPFTGVKMGSMEPFQGNYKISDVLERKRMTESFQDIEFGSKYNEEFFRKHNYIYLIPLMCDKEKYNKVKWDIWAFGVLIYFLIIGDKKKYDDSFTDRTLFNSEENIQTEINNLQKEFGISNELKELIKGCLVLQTDKRFGIIEVISSSWFKNFSETIGDKKKWLDKLKNLLG